MTTPEDVDSLISAAKRKQDKATLAAAIRALDAREVYYRATVSPTDDGQQVTTPLVRLSDGSHALVVYTSKSHPELPQQFGGAPWRHVLSMATRLPQADWLIVSTASGDWLPIHKTQIDVILQALGDAKSQKSIDVEKPKVVEDAALEDLIGRAQGAPSDEWSDSLLSRLRGRELYVRISPDRLEGGRPVLISSKIGEVGGLVQAYTSRSRPDFSYGGMSWDAIVDMVHNTPEIPGVHIINDDDDWVVLGRSEL